jgi:hypothetical protein
VRKCKVRVKIYITVFSATNFFQKKNKTEDKRVKFLRSLPGTDLRIRIIYRKGSDVLQMGNIIEIKKYKLNIDTDIRVIFFHGFNLISTTSRKHMG